MTRVGIPLRLPWDQGLEIRATHIELTKHGADIRYTLPFSTTGVQLMAHQIEKEFQNRPGKRPVQPTIVQDKYGCMAAALAMCTGHHHYHVKRLMGKHGWRNDNGGAPYHASREAARELGFDFMWLDRKRMYMLLHKIDNAVVSVPSLNLKGRCHAVAWVGNEILDPNWDRPGRLTYGAEWDPWTIGASGVEIILKPMSKIEYLDLETVVWYSDSERDIVQAVTECAA